MKKKLNSLWPVMSRALFASLILFMRGLGRRKVCHEDTTNQSSAIASDPLVPSEDTAKSLVNPAPLTQRAASQKLLPPVTASGEAQSFGDQSWSANVHRRYMNGVPRRSPLEVLRQVLRACGTCLRNRPQEEYFYRKRLEGFDRLALASGLSRPKGKVVLGSSLNSLANVKEHAPPPLKSDCAATEELHGGCCVSPCSESSSS